MIREPDRQGENGGAEGATSIDPDEADGLIPAHLTTRAELNQWEALNIARAQDWAFARRQPFALSVEALRELHRRMFDETWTWAGEFRSSDKNISPHNWTQVPVLMRDLVANTREQYKTSDTSPESRDDIAVRFHHQLVRITHGPTVTDVMHGLRRISF